MIRLEWSLLAEKCLKQIQEYGEETLGKSASDRFIGRLLSAAEQLTDFPFMGRVIDDLEDPLKRELIEGSYRIIYVIDSLQESHRGFCSWSHSQRAIARKHIVMGAA